MTMSWEKQPRGGGAGAQNHHLLTVLPPPDLQLSPREVTSTPGQIRYVMFLAHRKQSINGDFYHPLVLNIGGSGMFWLLDFGGLSLF